MSAVTDAVRVAPAANPFSQSVRDSMVVAKRNLIRMSRIPNPVHGASIRFSSPRAHGQRVSGGKGQPK
ncbi:integral membrane transport protein [Streptomyces caeruleatus]|uniref:integral membrane transport protein n=1 Tax=Streptomyces caeruleatus TaxID=661399 RepID=UPI00099F27E2|nr:integral membrane transport protein [Streptomyces caeruleatus]